MKEQVSKSRDSGSIHDDLPKRSNGNESFWDHRTSEHLAEASQSNHIIGNQAIQTILRKKIQGQYHKDRHDAIRNEPNLQSNHYEFFQPIRNSGTPIPVSARDFFESRFHRDFSQVRIHTSSEASYSAEAINSRAYTRGNQIVFGKGEYSPGTSSGKRLLAHELTHVLQQNQDKRPNTPNMKNGNDKSKLSLHPMDNTLDIQRQVSARESTNEDIIMRDCPRIAEQVVNPPPTPSSTQSWFVDAVGAVTDIAGAIVWGTLGMGEQHGTASSHLLHNIFGDGGELEVTREWIMGSPAWSQGYSGHLEDTMRRVAENATCRASEGESVGSDSFSAVQDFDAASGVDAPIPVIPGADQWLASGRAWFIIRGSYSWSTPENGLGVDIVISEITTEFYDRYQWYHGWDPGQHSRQERGWYAPFNITCQWTEPDRQFSGIFTAEPRFIVSDSDAMERLMNDD